jgi:hypothetical protein
LLIFNCFFLSIYPSPWLPLFSPITLCLLVFSFILSIYPSPWLPVFSRITLAAHILSRPPRYPLDLMSAVCDSLPAGTAPPLCSGGGGGDTASVLPAVLTATTAHPTPGVRQSAFALLGDLAQRARPLVLPLLPQLLPRMLQEIADSHLRQPAVASNAAWALGEIALGGGLAGTPPQGVRELATVLGGVLQAKGCVRSVRENAAIALGRVAAGGGGAEVGGGFGHVVAIMEAQIRFKSCALVDRSHVVLYLLCVIGE